MPVIAVHEPTDPFALIDAVFAFGTVAIRMRMSPAVVPAGKPGVASWAAAVLPVAARKTGMLTGYAAIAVMLSVSEPDGIVNVSPIATVFGAARSSEPRKVPAEEADQKDTWVYVSAVETFVHTTSAFDAIAPAAAAAKAAAFRVVSPAALFVPDAPGSPICSLTKKPAGSE